MSTILKAENISKQYRLGLVGSGTIKDDIRRFWASVRRKEDPFLKLGEVNDRVFKGSGDYVWALRDINFEVQQGEVLGIIGSNGAGKSTLLKLLSRVTAPTTGTIKTKGRIASLLEVGTGFHPELTGRENIYLNGAILGMTKAEITSKIDEIIEFSGCERYIDTPTKRYSSGMTVRLAFAVAAHLEPEILVVDEVLAVGDAEFQKRAIGKMQDISKGEGRTVLFVSHNMAAVRNLCTRGMVLRNGNCVFKGEVQESINEYLLLKGPKKKLQNLSGRSGNGIIKFVDIDVYGDRVGKPITVGTVFNLMFFIENTKKIPLERVRFDFRIDDTFGQRIFWFSNILKNTDNRVVPNSLTISIPKCTLNVGDYLITVFCSVDNICADWIENAFVFTVEEGRYYENGKTIPSIKSKIYQDFEIKFN